MENWSKIQSPDTLYIMPNSPDLEFCSFSYSHQGSPLNPKMCVSYLNVIYARPCGPNREGRVGPKEAFGDLYKSSYFRVKLKRIKFGL